ncbi:hypothetical protein [Neptunicella sp. SCSIO 80796]|uniref:hypothetical protein n=1 Tax=Neptunicella plasticusilytica TaxID=3117012 RepID=UPI003A4E107A
MKKLIDLKLTLLVLVVVGIITYVISYLTSLSFLAVFGITVVAALINGLVATKEDEVPCGFNNPNAKDATKK